MSNKMFLFFSFTWGVIMSAVGAIIVLALIIIGYRPEKFLYGYVFEIGENWGGVSFGPFMIVNKGASDTLKAHEFGHALQNCYFGPFMIFIAVASFIRYWYREYMISVKGYTLPREYYDIWFEGTATYLGLLYKDKFLK